MCSADSITAHGVDMAAATVFAQVVGLGHRESFRRCVQSHHGDAGINDFGCPDRWLATGFAQLTFRESLRDVESLLDTRSELLYLMGSRSTVRRSTLADANERRGWRHRCRLKPCFRACSFWSVNDRWLTPHRPNDQTGQRS